MRAGITGTIVWLLAVSACTGLVIDPAGQDGNSADITLANQGPPRSQPPEEVSGFVPTQIRDDIKASDENVAAPPACDLAISQVAAYQSIKTVLWQEGKIVEGGALLVAGKATLFRVFASPGPRWADRLAKARLTLTEPTGSVRVFETEKLMLGSSVDGNGASTFNFSIQGSSVTTETRYQVELDMGVECRRFEWSRSAPRQGPLPLGLVSVPTLELVLVPMKYGADGSHRLPDTSQQQLERVRSAMLAMLPTKDVKISVREPIATDLVLDTQSFPLFLDKIRAARAADNAGMNVHYLGLVSPSETLPDYCKGSCTAGLAFGNMNDDPTLRAGVALGFSGEESIRTVIHELGHTLGLKHAPCNTDDSVDALFPHKGGLVGVWGYDERQRKLRDPEAVGDFMGYCADHWISDFSYNKVLARFRSFSVTGGLGQALTTAFGAPGESFTSVWAPSSGKPKRGEIYGPAGVSGASWQHAVWRPQTGAAREVSVQSLAIDHAEGRLWLVPSSLFHQGGSLTLRDRSESLELPLH